MKKDITYFVKKYYEYLEKYKSRKTFNIYKLSIDRFVFVCSINQPSDISIDLINNKFYKYLKNIHKLSDTTITMSLQHIRFFLQFLEKEKMLTLKTSEIRDREDFKRIYKHYRTYQNDILESEEIDDINSYWKKQNDKDTPRITRNQSIINVLTDTGIFVSELSNLMREDIDFKKGIIKIKYNKKYNHKYKNRELKLSPETVLCLKNYISSRIDKCQALFVSFDVNNSYEVNAWPLTSRSIQRIIKMTAENAQIKKEITPSTFRFTLLVNKLKKNESVNKIREELGFAPKSPGYERFLHLVKNRQDRVWNDG